MPAFHQSLYGKISIVYLFLLLGLGIILMSVTARSYVQFTQEADQKLNRTLAQNLAQEFSPFVEDTLDVDGIKHTMHYLMVMNPRVEIYLLDESGRVLAYFADPEKIKQDVVDLEPVQLFLAETVPSPLLGDDPRNVGRTKPFSVAPIRINGQTNGYLYVILGGEAYDSAADMVKDSAIFQTTAVAVLIIVVFTALVGLVLFFFLTKRFRAMKTVVKGFTQGRLETRFPVHSSDEIGELGTAFNQMAETILANMAALRRSDELRRELVANISHDLRSPLASIHGYVETILMKAEQLDPAQRQRFLNTILDNTVMLNRLVESLFQLSKLDAHEIKPQLEPFSMAELAQDVVVKFKPRADQLQVTLTARLAPQLPMVYGDIGMIERVLSNLIDNALRYTPAGGAIFVGFDEAEGSLRVSVTDTGYGIPADEIPHLCERFYRVEKSRARDSGGSGLGLAIAHKILDLHQSTLAIESTVNVGTTVAFGLPTVVAAPRTAAQPVLQAS